MKDTKAPSLINLFCCSLQDGERESRLLVETLRSKLVQLLILYNLLILYSETNFASYAFLVFAMQEDARENLITSEKKARQLESQVQDEQLVSTNNKKVCI